MRLTTRIALVLFCLVMLTAACVTGLIFWRLDSQLVQAKVDELQRETAVQSTHFSDQIRELVRDTRILSNTPPVQGLIRSRKNAGTDPLTGFETSTWQDQLVAIFLSVLQHKPDYDQIRYIGIEDDGREIIRVDRRGEEGGPRRVAESDLQRKGNEPYLDRTLAQAPGEVYISSINLNRERGVIEQPHVPVIRAAIPIYSPANKPFGIIIINYRVSDAFQRLTRVANPDHAYYIVNESGHYLRHPEQRYEFDFEFGPGRLATRDFPLLKQLLGDEQSTLGAALQQEDLVIAARRVDFGPPAMGKAIYLIAADDFEDITAVSTETLQQLALVLTALVVIALVVGLWLSQRITWPIDALTESVRDMEFHKGTILTPSSLPAEAGELATALQESFDQLRRKADDLAASNRELKQFAYIASHDLQEPVRTINSFTSLLDSEFRDQLDEQGRTYLRFIAESSERMRLLIRGLLEYSRLGTQARPEKIDLNILLADIKQDMASTLEHSGADVQADHLPTITVYSLEFRLLLQNLLSNAVKYRHEDVAPLIFLRCRASAGGWLFEVEDNGIGISAEHRDRVFMIFQRLHGRREYEGTGIGLAHCRKVVELHHGRIWIEDAPGGGCLFRFWIEEVDEQA
jgi:signal transduction histidine kinase